MSKNKNVKVKINGSVSVDPTFLVSASNYGLLLFQKGKCVNVLKADNAFGITKYKDEWWTFINVKGKPSIVSFKLNSDGITDRKYRVIGAHKSVHQIDFIDDRLFVTDTKFNRVLVFDNISDVVYSGDFNVGIYPNGRLDTRFDNKGNVVREQVSDSYSHFNSVYRYGDKIYILAHNDSHRRNKPSEVYVLDSNHFGVVDKFKAHGSGCHNYYKDDKEQLICDSFGGCLRQNNVSVFNPGTFVRGLSVSDDYIIVGGSTFGKNKAGRNDRDGYIYILDRKTFKLLSTITIDKCQVMEIRRVDSKEYGFSNT